MKINELKNFYAEYQKKYNLPSFKELNNNFEIEKIERESEILLRIVRVVIMEKVIATERFIESILLPGNAPRSLYAYTSTMNEEDKKTLDKIHNSFSQLTLQALELDVEYNEKKEAEIIKKIFTTWSVAKQGLYPILEKMTKPIKQDSKKEKTYFG